MNLVGCKKKLPAVVLMLLCCSNKLDAKVISLCRKAMFRYLKSELMGKL